MIKINMYGDGVRIWLCHLEDELFSKMNKVRKHLPWEAVLFDLEFLNHFGFNHWSELSPSKEQLGFYLSQRNSIEIKHGNKRLSRFYASELLGSNSLFPIYLTVETTMDKLEDCSFVLLEYETGLMMSYSVNADQLVMDDLRFQLISLLGNSLLSGMIHKSNQLTVSKTDTVVRGNTIIWKPKD
jgi:hypothetical protein